MWERCPYLEFVQQQFEHLGRGHCAVDAHVGDGAVSGREHRGLRGTDTIEGLPGSPRIPGRAGLTLWL